MPKDKFGNSYFYPSKPGGHNFEMSDNPKNDNDIEGLDSDFSVSGNIITMKCNGPTSFSVGKNGRGFTDSIGGCKMDFAATAKRGYGYKADDVRDLEFKCWMRIPSNLSSGHDGFSMSACTGHHSASGCCQGFAYMGSIEGANSNPTHFRFRKETLHVEYTDSSEGTWTHPKANFKLTGRDWFGFGFCRYNKPTSGGTSPQDDSVVLEIWFNPDPTNDATDWTMLKRTEDKKGRGWTGSKGKCNGDNDQIGVWSNAHNRLKSNSTSGTIQFTNLSFREIDPFGTFDTEPPPTGGGTVQRWIKYAMVSGTPSTYLHLTSVTGHEIIETITDPDPLNTFGGQAWGNSAGKEVSDPCENIFTAYADGLDVEGYWSNSDDKCVVPGLTIPDTVQVPAMTNRKGGAVLAHGKVYLIYWGSDWQTRVTTPTATTLTDKIQNDMLGTDATYFSKLSQYGVSTPTWGGTAFNTTFPIPSTTAIKEIDGRACIVDTLQKGLLPMPTDTNEDVFILYVPVGKDITPLGSSSTPGGFHDIWHPSMTPPPVACPTGFHRDTNGACIPDTITCPAGQHESNGICIDDEPPGGDPNPPSKITGSFVLLSDINISRSSPCSGSTGGSGGGGGIAGTPFYQVTPDGTSGGNALDNTRHGIYEFAAKSTSIIIGKLPVGIDLYIKKVGSPTGTATAVHRTAAATDGGTDDTIKQIFGTIDVSTISTTETLYTFGPITNTTKKIIFRNKIGLEYSGGDANNYIVVSRNKPGFFDAQNTYKLTKEGTAYVQARDYDLCGIFYESSGATPGVDLDTFGVAKIYPTKSGGREWFSTAWASGGSRSISEVHTDAGIDENFAYSDGAPSSNLTITGSSGGVASTSTYTTSNRLYANGPWRNSETTAYVRIRGTNTTARSDSTGTPPISPGNVTGARNVQLHCRSGHSLAGPGAFAIPLCHFGGYSVLWNRDSLKVAVEVEALDHCIDRHLGEQTMSQQIPSGPSAPFVGFKVIVRTLTSTVVPADKFANVKVEGWINYDVTDQTGWTKCTEYTFDGTNVSMDALNPSDGNHDTLLCCQSVHAGTPPQTDVASGCTTVPEASRTSDIVCEDIIYHSAWDDSEKMSWIRCDDCDNMDYKFFSVREIDALP